MPQAGLTKQFVISEGNNQNVPLIPAEYELMQNYPNPFNPTTTISYAVPKTGAVNLAIYNLRGQQIKMLFSGLVAAGRYKVVWNGEDDNGVRVASGIYMYSLKAKDFVANKRLVLVK